MENELTENTPQQLNIIFLYGMSYKLIYNRDCLLTFSVDDFMVTLLDSGKRDVVYTVCGVLVNLMADEDKRPNLKKLGGIKLYVHGGVGRVVEKCI